MDDVQMRRMLPSKRDELPRWELTRDGRIIGWVRSLRIGHSTPMFYEAIGVDPAGERVSLECSGDRDERIAQVAAFDVDPEPWRGVHWHPRQS